MHILNNGRMSLGTGSVGATKVFLDLIIDHVSECSSSTARLQTSSWSRTRSAGWSPTCSAWRP